MNYGPLGIHQKLLSKDVCKHGISFYNLYQYECFEEWQYISNVRVKEEIYVCPRYVMEEYGDTIIHYAR